MGVKAIYFFVALLGSTLALPSVEPQPDDDSPYLISNRAESRIVGGTLAAEASHPHMVALSDGLLFRSIFCGGSLISFRTVLTAAHCLTNVYRSGQLSRNLRGTVGTNRWNSGGTSFTFERNVTHPHYVRSLIKNDIALLITTSNVAASNRVAVAPLSFAFVGVNVPVRVAGWGATRAGGSTQSQLRELSMETISGGRCMTEVPIAAASVRPPRIAPPVEPEIEICTFHSRGHGTCQGDSGSALIRRDTGQLVGVVSWGIPCAVGGPDMFVRVGAYRSWFEENIV